MTSVEYGDDPYMTRAEVLAGHGIVAILAILV
jgi:hypothetical protein